MEFFTRLCVSQYKRRCTIMYKGNILKLNRCSITCQRKRPPLKKLRVPFMERIFESTKQNVLKLQETRVSHLKGKWGGSIIKPCAKINACLKKEMAVGRKVG